jgi:hypothetical protein
MKNVILIIFFFSSTVIISQEQSKFTELRGFEDVNGNTHLFYRMGSNENALNNIYHLNINVNSDSLFLYTFSYSAPYNVYYAISDFDFIENNPQKYIWCGLAMYPDNVGYISFYNNIGSFSKFDAINNIELSRQDTNLIYADYNRYLIKSIDYGLTWDDENIEYLPNFRLISLSPFNDKILFCLNYNNHLVKSINAGTSFQTVDSTYWFDLYTTILYDKDSIHIYALTEHDKKWRLFLSKDSGNSFKNIYESDLILSASIDLLNSGSIFLCDGNIIYKSNDYGISFSYYNEVSSKIISIYAKPNSDEIFVETEKNLINFNNQGLHYLKTLTGIEKKNDNEKNYKLLQNYPNPFNPTTNIGFHISEFGFVNLKVYDILGNEVATLVNEEKPAGNYEVEFSAGKLSSGIYFYVLKTGENRFCKKMCLVK